MKTLQTRYNKKNNSINLPKDIMWDYKNPPDDYLWGLQRIVDFFPLYGRDKDTVFALYKNIKKLKVEETTKILIKEYHKMFKNIKGKNEGRKNRTFRWNNVNKKS